MRRRHLQSIICISIQRRSIGVFKTCRSLIRVFSIARARNQSEREERNRREEEKKRQKAKEMAKTTTGSTYLSQPARHRAPHQYLGVGLAGHRRHRQHRQHRLKRPEYAMKSPRRRWDCCCWSCRRQQTSTPRCRRPRRRRLPQRQPGCRRRPWPTAWERTASRTQWSAVGQASWRIRDRGTLPVSPLRRRPPGKSQ